MALVHNSQTEAGDDLLPILTSLQVILAFPQEAADPAVRGYLVSLAF